MEHIWLPWTTGYVKHMVQVLTIGKEFVCANMFYISRRLFFLLPFWQVMTEYGKKSKVKGIEKLQAFTKAKYPILQIPSSQKLHPVLHFLQNLVQQEMWHLIADRGLVMAMTSRDMVELIVGVLLKICWNDNKFSYSICQYFICYHSLSLTDKILHRTCEYLLAQWYWKTIQTRNIISTADVTIVCSSFWKIG